MLNSFKNKFVNITFYSLFTLAYSFFLSLGLTCLLNLLGIAFSLSLDKGAALSYPRFIPFCLVTGFFCIAFIVILVIFNVKFSKKLRYTNFVWFFQFISAFAISFFAMKPWEIFFDYLQKTF